MKGKNRPPTPDSDTSEGDFPCCRHVRVCRDPVRQAPLRAGADKLAEGFHEVAMSLCTLRADANAAINLKRYGEELLRKRREIL